MFSYLYQLLSSAYVQVVILFLLIIYFFSHRKDPRLVVSGLSLFRTIILLLIFLYFLWNWSSEIPPSLRDASVLGMFLINFYMAFNLVLTRLERPYREALEAYGREPDKSANLEKIWHTGKRLFYMRYFKSSLFSGGMSFLHAMTVDRVRADIKETLARYGVEKEAISLKTMAAYLKNTLACDEALPGEFKEMMVKEIDEFTKHPWIEDNTDKFLHLAVETPENLHVPEWQAKYEQCVKSDKK